jgi:hypothetical protein
METWNREELYKEIWEIPLVKRAPKYGISAVALGKVCRKLQIPLQGRGYLIERRNLVTGEFSMLEEEQFARFLFRGEIRNH